MKVAPLGNWPRTLLVLLGALAASCNLNPHGEDPSLESAGATPGFEIPGSDGMSPSATGTSAGIPIPSATDTTGSVPPMVEPPGMAGMPTTGPSDPLPTGTATEMAPPLATMTGTPTGTTTTLPTTDPVPEPPNPSASGGSGGASDVAPDGGVTTFGEIDGGVDVASTLAADAGDGMEPIAPSVADGGGGGANAL